MHETAVKNIYLSEGRVLKGFKEKALILISDNGQYLDMQVKSVNKQITFLAKIFKYIMAA